MLLVRMLYLSKLDLHKNILLLCGFSFLVVCLFYFCFYFQKAQRSEFPVAKDEFLSVFQSQDDMETFLSYCVDKQGLKVNAMFLKQQLK